MKKEAFERLVYNLQTQDNLATEDPIFEVQEKIRIYNMDSSREFDESIWVNGEDSFETDDEVREWLNDPDTDLKADSLQWCWELRDVARALRGGKLVLK